MIVTGEAVYYYIQARSYILLAESALTLKEDFLCINRAAGCISQSAEFILKGRLFAEGIIPSSTHKHSFLAKELGQHHIRVPKSVLEICGQLYDWEASLRYDYADNVYESEVLDAIEIVKRYYEIVWAEYMPLVANHLRCSLPPAVLACSDMELIRDYWSTIERKVDTL